MDEAFDVRNSLQTKAQFRPDHPGPYLASETAEDVADASDVAVAVSDVLEAANFTQNVVQTHADVTGIRADVLGAPAAPEAASESSHYIIGVL